MRLEQRVHLRQNLVRLCPPAPRGAQAPQHILCSSTARRGARQGVGALAHRRCPKVDPQIAEFAYAVNRNKLRRRRAAHQVLIT
jgi:hypothetical protein